MIKIENNKVIDWGFNLSYSTYSVYRESPLLFFYKKILYAKPDTELYDGYGIIGNIVHSCCEEKIKNNNFDMGALLKNEWFIKQMSSKKGVFNSKFKIEKYLTMLKILKLYIESKKNIKQSLPELKIEFKFDRLENITVKGFIDWVIIDNDDNVFFYDWKTNSSNSYELHREQRLFYSWLYWKKYGVIAKSCEWVYVAKVLKLWKDNFTLEELKTFEDRLIKDLMDIKSFGNNISNYNLGDISSPFNQHKKKCEQIQLKRLLKKSDLELTITKQGHLCKLTGVKTPELLKMLIKKMSYKEKSSFVIKAFNEKKGQDWDGTYKMYNARDGTFAIGLLHIVEKVLRHYMDYKKIPVVINYKDQRKSAHLVEMPDKLNIEALRPKQEEYATLSEEKENGIFSSATGTGKTVLAIEITRRHSMKTLFIVDRIKLVKQTHKAFEDKLGMECGLVYGSKKEFKDITIATWQSINSMLESNDSEQKTFIKKYLASIDLVFWDECHTVATKKFQKISNAMHNCKKRFGLSGTPRRLDGHDMKMNAICGPIIAEYQYEAIEDGTLMKPKIFFINFKQNVSPKTPTKFNKNITAQNKALMEYRLDYEEFIMTNSERDDVTIELVKKFEGKKILIMALRVEHVNKLAERLKCNCITNETSLKERSRIEKEFEECESGILVSTGSIFGTGVDIPNINRIINVAANKNENEILQKIGRGLRKTAGKENIIFVDFYDKGISSFENAARIRVKEFRDYGHEVIIVNKLEDING